MLIFPPDFSLLFGVCTVLEYLHLSKKHFFSHRSGGLSTAYTHHPLSTLSSFLFPFHSHSLQPSICNRAPQKETQSTHLSFILPLSFPLEHLLTIFLTFIISCYIPTLFVFPSSIPHPPSPPAAVHQHSLSFFHYPNIVLVFYSHPHILLVRFYLPTTFKLICLLPLPPSAPTFKNKTFPSLLLTHTHFSPPPTHNSYSIVIIYLTSPLVLSLTHKHSLTSHSNPLFTPFPPYLPLSPALLSQSRPRC